MPETSTKPATIETWVDDYTDDLYSWAFHKTSDPELAKDLTQDTFLAALQGFERFSGKSSPKTWLFSILNNKIVDHYRRKIRNSPLDETRTSEQHVNSFFNTDENWTKGKAPETWDMEDGNLLDDNDFVKIFTSCVELLPQKWKLSVQYKYYSGKPADEICQELEISPSNYWQILHRSKLQLRDCLEKNWFKK